MVYGYCTAPNAPHTHTHTYPCIHTYTGTISYSGASMFLKQIVLTDLAFGYVVEEC